MLISCAQNDPPQTDADRQMADTLHRHRVFELLLAVVTLGSLAALLACQVWMQMDRGQTVATWAGLVYDAEPAAASFDGLYGSVTIELLDYSELEQAFVLINGQKAGVFDSTELTLRVFDGDVLELDTTAYRAPVRFRLRRVSAGINESFLFDELELCGERRQLGRIVF